MNRRYYFDWAATAPPDASASAADASTIPFGNPSSKHTEGRRARAALEDARCRCAAVLEVDAKQVYFTSGGTEANAIVLHSLLLRKSRSGSGGLLYSAVEHPSIRENAALLERLGKPVIQIGVEKDGRVSPDTLGRALEKAAEPRMAAIMAVNNETGAVMDMKALTGIIREQGPAIHVHCDMVQGTGKIPVDLAGWDVDSACLSAHKLGGPRGIGLLYLRKSLEVINAGGGQEGGIRPGTENVAGALALADCLERHARPETVRSEYDAAAVRMKALIEGLMAIGRCSLLPRSRQDEPDQLRSADHTGSGDAIGFGERFSPYILQAAFDGVPGEVMVRALDDAGFAVSTGSACSSDKKARPILAAMGVDEKKSFEGIRISQGWSTSVEDIGALVGGVRGILRRL